MTARFAPTHPPREAPARVAYVLRAFPRLSETFIFNEIHGLLRLGHEVRIFPLELVDPGLVHLAAESLRPFVVPVPDTPEIASASRRHSGVPCAHLPAWRAGAWIANQLRLWGADHVHAHFAGPAASAAARAADLANVPFTFTAHAKDIFVTKVNWHWLRRVAASSECVVTVCDYNLRFLREKLPPRVRVERVHNGIDTSAWRPSRRRHASRSGGLQLLTVGRLVRKKGIHVLLDAVAELRERGVKVFLRVVGDGVERPSLEAQARALRIGRYVRFLGAQTESQVRRHMHKTDVFVLPCLVDADGNQDALPTVLLEAAACGVPAVSTPVAGIPEIVCHGRTGLLVPPEAVSPLAAALSALARSRRLRTQMGRAARRHAEKRFDISRSTALLANIFASGSFHEDACHARSSALS